MIMEKARELGLALSESPEFLLMLRSRSAMDADQEVTGMIDAYNEKQGTILELLETSDADGEVIQGLSAEMDEIQSKLMASPVFITAMGAQSAFQQLMNRVNREIGACLGMSDGEPSACSGSCSTCNGCTH